ncbi:hypothetical protein MRX96_044847 [Rhipicephalus microplus]
MSLRGSRPWNWDDIDCPKFKYFTNADTPQDSRSLESYFDTHEETPPITVGRKLTTLSSPVNKMMLKSLENVDHASQSQKGQGTQLRKSACTSDVSSSDHGRVPRSNALLSCVHKPNYTLHPFKRGRPTRGTQEQTPSLPSSFTVRVLQCVRTFPIHHRALRCRRC